MERGQSEFLGEHNVVPLKMLLMKVEVIASVVLDSGFKNRHVSFTASALCRIGRVNELSRIEHLVRYLPIKSKLLMNRITPMRTSVVEDQPFAVNNLLRVNVAAHFVRTDENIVSAFRGGVTHSLRCAFVEGVVAVCPQQILWPAVLRHFPSYLARRPKVVNVRKVGFVFVVMNAVGHFQFLADAMNDRLGSV